MTISVKATLKYLVMTKLKQELSYVRYVVVATSCANMFLCQPCLRPPGLILKLLNCPQFYSIRLIRLCCVCQLQFVPFGLLFFFLPAFFPFPFCLVLSVRNGNINHVSIKIVKVGYLNGYCELQ